MVFYWILQFNSNVNPLTLLGLVHNLISSIISDYPLHSFILRKYFNRIVYSMNCYTSQHHAFLLYGTPVVSNLMTFIFIYSFLICKVGSYSVCMYACMYVCMYVCSYVVIIFVLATYVLVGFTTHCLLSIDWTLTIGQGHSFLLFPTALLTGSFKLVNINSFNKNDVICQTKTA